MIIFTVLHAGRCCNYENKIAFIHSKNIILLTKYFLNKHVHLKHSGLLSHIEKQFYSLPIQFTTLIPIRHVLL